MTPASDERSFDALSRADLDRVYERGREELLRDRAFRVLLERTDTVEKLEALAFSGERGLSRWTTRELIEISNHFRLLSAPDDEIRVYQECRDEAFRRAPRVREFYLLALNRARRPAEAIEEGARMIAHGGENALVLSTLGDSYTARMLFAEQVAEALAQSRAHSVASHPDLVGDSLRHFPTIDPGEMTAAKAQSLRRENLRTATSFFRRSFGDSGLSFPGLGWMLRTIDALSIEMVDRATRRPGRTPVGSNLDDEVSLQIADDRIAGLEREIEAQVELVDIALELEGGGESADCWTHAGRLLLAVVRGEDPATIRARMARFFATVDARFKLDIVVSELQRLLDQYEAMVRAQDPLRRSLDALTLKAAAAEFALAECRAGRARCLGGTMVPGCLLNAEYRNLIESEPEDAVSLFLERTVNFLALTRNLVPLHILGSIGVAGARVPDLLINRQVQEDLLDIVETKILQPLTPDERDDPREVIARIQRVVGQGFCVGDLQDLQCPAHHAFDIRSAGLIALSGVDEDMRKKTRTATELTATLLMQNGDCRETMYLNGAIFACWQQRQVGQLLARAMTCLELDDDEGFRTIVDEEIPKVLRYRLRGGQFTVYGESIAMRNKYECERAGTADPTAVERTYGVEDLRAGRPLTDYELAHSKIEITYADGATRWVDPRDPAGGRRPIEHVRVPGGGLPVLPGAGPDYDNIRSLRLLNMIEDHAATFLYDTREKSVEFCDGFYNEALYDSPYSFGSGAMVLEDLCSSPGLLRAGTRLARRSDGSRGALPLWLAFLPYSRTQYDYDLVEGDIPGTIHFMGRTFEGDLKRERRRLEEGTSPLPILLERVEAWQSARERSRSPERMALERRLARLILDLAWNEPESVEMVEVEAAAPIIVEATDNDHVYLVLSGSLQVFRRGRALEDTDGHPVVVTAGGVVGEISALTGERADATVAGDAVVLSVAMSLIRRELETDPALRQSVEELVGYRRHTSR